MESPQTIYRRYNKRYFGGELPDIPVKWGVTHPFHAAEYWPEDCEPGQRIVVSIELKGLDKYMKMLILHESVHVKLRNAKCQDHGHKFQREMKRLASIGAFNGLW